VSSTVTAGRARSGDIPSELLPNVITGDLAVLLVFSILVGGALRDDRGHDVGRRWRVRRRCRRQHRVRTRDPELAQLAVTLSPSMTPANRPSSKGARTCWTRSTT
jgi:hypothetical protein